MSWGVALRNAVGLGLGGIPSLLNAPPYASLAFNFLSGELDSRITFTRASTGTYVNSSGVLTSAAINTPRFDYDPATLAPKGLLIEEQRTNSIRNNTAQGAVAGTPGTIPTNWGIAGTANGITRTIVGTGVESGIAYLDVQYAGTTIAAGNISITAEQNNQIAAVQNQVWTHSCYARLIAGSFANTTSRVLFLNSYTAAGGFDANAGSTINNFPANGPTTAPLVLQRYFLTGTLASATTAFVNSGLYFTYDAGAVLDFTLRIGLPQLEQGAFATSVIPTTTTALTRAADLASMTGANFSNWYNQSEGTLYFEGSVVGSTGADQIGLNANNSAFTERVRLGKGPTTPRFTIVDDGVVQADLNGGTWAVNAVKKLAGAYAANSIALSVDGATPLLDTAATIPTPTQLQIGNEQLATFLNGHIRSFKYYNTRLSNGQLQSLTVPPLWTPAALGASLALWLDAADASTITLNGSTVSQWSDKSGNGRNVVQATAASQPTYNATGLNSKPTLTADTTRNLSVATTGFSGGDSLWVIAVASMNAAAQNYARLVSITSPTADDFNSNTTTAAILRVSTGNSIGAFRGTLMSNGGVSLSTPTIIDSIYNGTNHTAYINGVAQTPVASTGNFTNVPRITLFGYLVNPANSQWSGSCSEVIIGDSTLSTDNRQKLEGYLAWKWGLQADLPVGHPYKIAPPTV